ncbi:lipopolysaccharide biosynthesis protein [Vibrio cyclitrophicus]|uniref:lipopolysaccharide biosynthesis protein n=1 Tax=Vibrio cyclitrophicus TaxID=47951 RepID=UPI000C864C36|nr:lipopolysaccharide biosynthesis protein [Vibrio cyclitrophicus]PMK00915.1 lipopolysaccharide biosynthesis protein [Vibrio cyclitrophicus]
MHDKNKIKSGFVWSALDSLGTQVISLVISLTLANILGPSVFGLVAMLTIFMAIANVFVNSGFSQALIRKLDRNEADYSTTFYFSLVVSVVCYFILYYFAPYIADFYQQAELTLLTRVIALVIIINTFAIIPRVKLSVNLNFKTQAKCSLLSLMVSGLFALGLAFNGYGVWALVVQQLTLALVNVLLLNFFIQWWPKQQFSNESFKELFGFGSKLLLSGLLDAIYKNIYGLIIGRQFNATQLGLFNQADKLSSVPAMTLTSIIQKVTYPLLSSMQDDTKRLDQSYLVALQFAAFIIFPVMLGISITAVPLIDIILGQDWQGSAEYISIISIAFALYPIHAINLNMLQVKGRSDLFLKVEIIKKTNQTIMLFITVPISIKAMCIGMVITSFLALLINTYYTGKLSSLTFFKQIMALFPIGIISIVSATIGYVFGVNMIGSILQIVTMLSVVLISYFVIMLLLQRQLLTKFKNTLKA